LPLAIYFSDGYAKVEIAVATGKRDWDKRQTLAEREANREAEREMSRHVRDPAQGLSPGKSRACPIARPVRGDKMNA